MLCVTILISVCMETLMMIRISKVFLINPPKRFTITSEERTDSLKGLEAIFEGRLHNRFLL